MKRDNERCQGDRCKTGTELEKSVTSTIQRWLELEHLADDFDVYHPPKNEAIHYHLHELSEQDEIAGLDVIVRHHETNIIVAIFGVKASLKDRRKQDGLDAIYVRRQLPHAAWYEVFRSEDIHCQDLDVIRKDLYKWQAKYRGLWDLVASSMDNTSMQKMRRHLIKHLHSYLSIAKGLTNV